MWARREKKQLARHQHQHQPSSSRPQNRRQPPGLRGSINKGPKSEETGRTQRSLLLHTGSGRAGFPGPPVAELRSDWLSVGSSSGVGGLLRRKRDNRSTGPWSRVRARCGLGAGRREPRHPGCALVPRVPAALRELSTTYRQAAAGAAGIFPAVSAGGWGRGPWGGAPGGEGRLLGVACWGSPRHALSDSGSVRPHPHAPPPSKLLLCRGRERGVRLL